MLPVVIDDNPTSFFCLGTLTYKVDELEPTNGRLLVFNAVEGSILRSSDLRLYLAAWARVQGCVYALTSMHGMIVAAVNASVCGSTGTKQFTDNFTGAYLFP
jgi:DNA damage-binding protein 1